MGKVLLLFVALAIAGCAVEGAGFRNNGAYKAPACVKERRGNTEVWGNC
jgi:hypothetical protein